MAKDDYNPRPIDYARPTPPDVPPSLPVRRRMVMGFFLARVVWTFTAVLLGVVMVIAPMVERTFRDNKAELSAGSKLLFATSRFLSATYLWIPIAAAALALPFLVALWASGVGDEDARRAGVRLITVVLFLVGAALTVWVVLSLFLPYVSMLQSLTGGVGD